MEKLKNIQLQINELIYNETKKEYVEQNDIIQQLEYLVSKINNLGVYEFSTGYGVKNVKNMFNLFLKTLKTQNEKINILEEKVKNLSGNHKSSNPFDLI